jgi:thioredoxin-like negative regulator of GroEL
MIERSVILLALAAAVLLAGRLVRHYANRKRTTAMETLELPAEVNGQSRIVNFYGPSCDACDRQKLVLADLESGRPGRLTVEHHDASRDYDYARKFGLMVVPTTVVIRPGGAIAGINSGFTTRTTLEAQLDAA